MDEMDTELSTLWGRLKYHNPLLKLGIVGLVGFLAFADYRVVVTFVYPFTGIDINIARFYGLLVSICSKGSAFFAGISLAIWINAVMYRRNFGKHIKFRFLVSLFTTITSSVAIAILGWIIIRGKGGAEAFMGKLSDVVYRDFPVDAFLTFLPLLSSLIAMNTSWFAFRKVNDIRLKINNLEDNDKSEGG
jgi:uncharacterized membrane protein YjdF